MWVKCEDSPGIRISGLRRVMQQLRETGRSFKREPRIHRYANGHVRGRKNYMKVQRLGFGTTPSFSYVSDSHTSHKRRKSTFRMVRDTAVCPVDRSTSQTMRGTLGGKSGWTANLQSIFAYKYAVIHPQRFIELLIHYLQRSLSPATIKQSPLSSSFLSTTRQSRRLVYHSKATAIMKFNPAIIVALAAVAAAAPDDTNPPKACTPGTYACTTDAKGWQVCDVSGQFVVSEFTSWQF